MNTSAQGRTALCLLPGCGRELTINPAQAHQPVHCDCPRRARLVLGLAVTGQWVLRPSAYDQYERAEHNAIAHALITGQTTTPTRRGRPDTAPDATSAALVDAANARTRAANDMERFLLTGDLRRAREAAETYAACRTAQTLLTRNYKSQRRREVDKKGLWHRDAEFYIDSETGPLHFTFEAMYVDEQRVPSEETGEGVTGKPVETGTALRVVNARTIEVDSGVPVGDEGWRQLIRLLQRIETGKPGKPVDTEALIWKTNDRDELILRPYIRSHYPQAVLALEALRRSLRPDQLGDRPWEALGISEEDWRGRQPSEAQPEPAEAWQSDGVIDESPPSVEALNKDLLLFQRHVKPRTGKIRIRR